MAPGVFPESLRQVKQETDFLNQTKFVKRKGKVECTELPLECSSLHHPLCVLVRDEKAQCTICITIVIHIVL